jgi:hypothetical protein
MSPDSEGPSGLRATVAVVKPTLPAYVTVRSTARPDFAPADPRRLSTLGARLEKRAFRTPNRKRSNQIWISATMIWSRSPQQIAKKSIRRSRWRGPHGRRPASLIRR